MSVLTEDQLLDLSNADIIKLVESQHGVTLGGTKESLIQGYLKLNEAKVQAELRAKEASAKPKSNVPEGFVKLVIQRDENRIRAGDVFAAHNGRAFQIPRNKEIVFDAKCISCLTDAVENQAVFDPEIKTAVGTGATVSKPGHSYPISFYDWGPGTEEIKEYVEGRMRELAEKRATMYHTTGEVTNQ